MTDTTVPTETATLVDIHLAAYAEPDRARRTELLGQVWAGDGQLLDPPFDGAGVDAIADLVDTVLEHFPGHAFRRTTVVDEHHGFARYGWDLVGPDGTVAVGGTDVAEIVDGRLVRVVGFFGDLAAVPAA
ncbi:MAG TPA: hypothetical protein VNS19_11295 [Acidimicrobiales bacterium]|jgi:hypothetical protein|nr:hypothetical protein [Acidimicrobiales bacterium]